MGTLVWLRKNRAVAAFVALALVAGCGGGGGSSSGPAPLVPPPTATPFSGASTPPTAVPAVGSAAATFTVTVPKSSTATAGRNPRYIASNTAAIGFTLVKSDAPGATTGTATQQIFALNAGQSYCTGVAGGLQCALNVNAPIGNDVYVAATYSDAAGTQKLGSGAVQLAVQANARNTASISLGGPIATVATVAFPTTADFYTRLLAGAPAPVAQASGTPSPYATGGLTFYPSARLYVVGLDVNNNVIVAPDNYSTPVTLTVSNGSPVYGNYGSSGTRQPRAGGATPPPTPGPSATPTPVPTAVPTATPTATPVPTATPIAAIITVTHRDGTTASTSLTNFSVNVTAPDDVVTVTPTTTTQSPTYGSSSYYYNQPIGFVITATVPGANVSRTLNVQPANCPSGFSGSPPSCVFPTPAATPTSAPTPCPNGFSGTPPSCTIPQVTFSGAYPRLQTAYSYDAQGYFFVATVQFLSTNDAPITLTVSDSTTVGSPPQIWITDDSTASCASLLKGGIMQAVTLTGSPGSYSGTFTLAPSTGGAFGACRLSAWAYPNDGTRWTVPINISVNNVTGTIQ